MEIGWGDSGQCGYLRLQKWPKRGGKVHCVARGAPRPIRSAGLV
jgi:hypothetical protein